MRTTTMIRKYVEYRTNQAVTPCVHKTWIDCVESLGNRVIVWYNGKDHSTHTITLTEKELSLLFVRNH